MEYLQKDYFSSDLIGELWEKLNKLHQDSSPVFSPAFARNVFADRKKELLEKARKASRSVTALFPSPRMGRGK